MKANFNAEERGDDLGHGGPQVDHSKRVCFLFGKPLGIWGHPFHEPPMLAKLLKHHSDLGRPHLPSPAGAYADGLTGMSSFNPHL